MPGVSVVTAAVKVVTGVPQFGSNDETDNALIARCLDRWPSLTDIGTEDRVEVWARAASTEVTRLRFDADVSAGHEGGVFVTVAGAGGAVSGGAVTAVQNYIDARAPITDYITAQNASNLTITAAGTVTVPLAQLVPVQTAADAAWNAYLATATIGGKVYMAELLQAVMDAGALDISGILLNTVAADVTLSSNQVPVPNGSGLATLLTWVTV
jgi:phage-related baseplate assembly protein